MDRVELFPGWEVRRATFDCGTKHGIAIQRTVNGKRQRHAIRCEATLAAEAVEQLRQWALEQAA